MADVVLSIDLDFGYGAGWGIGLVEIESVCRYVEERFKDA